MVVYTHYVTDARVRREAETLASLPDTNVRVLTLRQGLRSRTYILESVTVEEVNISKYRGKETVKYLLSYTNFLFRAFLCICRLLFNRDVDIVHVHNMPNYIVFSALPAKLLGKKVILDVHDTMVETFATKFKDNRRGIIYKLLLLEESISCRFADRIICVNDVQKQKMVDRGIPEDKITTLLNVPDNKFFNYDSLVVIREPDQDFKLIYHGTVTWRLGIELAINAVDSLKNTLPGLKFIIMGGGDDLDRCRDLTGKLEAEGVVNFKDPVPIEDLAGILKEMSLGIVPNRASPASDLMLPVKMLEYVALGIPVVAPRLRTIEHYFTDEMVYFFEPDDVKLLAEAILQAHGDKAGRIQKVRNSKVFLHEYGWDTHKKILFDLYREIETKGGKHEN